MSRRFVSILLIYAIAMQLSCNCVPVVLAQRNRDLNELATQNNHAEKNHASEMNSIPVSFEDDLARSQSASDPFDETTDEDFSFLASCLIDLDSIDRQQNIYFLDNASGPSLAISRSERTANPLVCSPFVSAGVPIASNCYNTSVFSKIGSALNQVRIQYNRPLLI